MPAFRATVWSYDPRLQSGLGQALLQLAEHTLTILAGDTASASRQRLSELIAGNSDISESDALRFAEIIQVQTASVDMYHDFTD